jgi:hypothetical protein
MSLDVNALIADDQARLSDGISAVREYYNIKQALTNPNITEDQKWQMSTMLNDMRHSGRFNNLNRIYDHARQNGIILEKELSALEGDLGTTGNVWDVIKGQLSKSKDKVRLDPFTTGVIGALDDLTFGAIKNNYYDASTEKAANVGRWVGTGVGLALPGIGMLKGISKGGAALKGTKELIKAANGLMKTSEIVNALPETIKATDAGIDLIRRVEHLSGALDRNLSLVGKGDFGFNKGVQKAIGNAVIKDSKTIMKEAVGLVTDVPGTSLGNVFDSLKSFDTAEKAVADVGMKKILSNMLKPGIGSEHFLNLAKQINPSLAAELSSRISGNTLKDIAKSLVSIKGPITAGQIARIAKEAGSTKEIVMSTIPLVLPTAARLIGKKRNISQHAMNAATPPSMDMSSGGAMDVSIWIR